MSASFWAIGSKAAVTIDQRVPSISNVVGAIQKPVAGATTNLKARLDDLVITQGVLCGAAASIGIESTARQAYELGLNVTIALDAITDFNAAALKSSSEIIYPLINETGTSDEIIALLGDNHG